MNYFHYFTEIEDAFIRRRGKHLLVGTIDWALMQSWKDMGVPLHVVLNGIERAFDSYEAKPRRRSVKTLFYCQEEVEAQYAEWLDAQVGAPVTAAAEDGQAASDKVETNGNAKEDDARLPFPRDVVMSHLECAGEALTKLRDDARQTHNVDFRETLARVVARLEELASDFAQAARPDAERLETALTQLEKLLDEALRANLSTTEQTALRADAEAQLAPYRSRMESVVYEQTLDNLLLKRLRDRYGVPRLSLFYL